MLLLLMLLCFFWCYHWLFEFIILAVLSISLVLPSRFWCVGHIVLYHQIQLFTKLYITIEADRNIVLYSKPYNHQEQHIFYLNIFVKCWYHYNSTSRRRRHPHTNNRKIQKIFVVNCHIVPYINKKNNIQTIQRIFILSKR